MVRRTLALWKDQYIGIESIYTVINGKQVNIPEKIAELRKKSRANELYCPCGCGSNLILVAGDRMLREQHFRLKDSENAKKCHMVDEGEVSLNSKIVLKCWLDAELGDEDLRMRVPVCDIRDTEKKFEFTFLSEKKKVALSYCCHRVNRTEEKLSILDENHEGLSLYYVDDIGSLGSDGQYPEALMRVQNRQGYCLLLKIEGMDYDKASLTAILHVQDAAGLWKEFPIAEGKLTDYHLDADGRLLFQKEPMDQRLARAKVWYAKWLEAQERKRQEEEQKRAEEAKHQEELKQKQEEERQKREEERRKQEEERRIREEQEREARRREREERERQEQLEIAARQEAFLAEVRLSMEKECEQQEHQARDPWGDRWVKCENCGKVDLEREFRSYGGPGRLNLGICRKCADENPSLLERQNPPSAPKKLDPMACPVCGGRLRERSGPYGSFLGCSNYPKCRYVKKLPKS